MFCALSNRLLPGGLTLPCSRDYTQVHVFVNDQMISLMYPLSTVPIPEHINCSKSKVDKI